MFTLRPLARNAITARLNPALSPFLNHVRAEKYRTQGGRFAEPRFAARGYRPDRRSDAPAVDRARGDHRITDSGEGHAGDRRRLSARAGSRDDAAACRAAPGYFAAR